MGSADLVRSRLVIIETGKTKQIEGSILRVLLFLDEKLGMVSKEERRVSLSS